MNNKILVTYATKHGATAEIAEKIGAVVQAAGLAVEVLPVDQVETLSKYQAVVFGSAVYMGQWRKEAINFLEANEQTFAEMPVWFFSSGPTGEGNPVALMKGWEFPEAQKPIADRIQPRAIAVFHGILDTHKLNFAEKLMVKGVKAPIGDFRDWDAIDTWASEIAATLKAENGQTQPLV